MSAVSITANASAMTKRTAVLSGEKKSNFDYPQTESLANGGIGGTSRDLIRSEAIIDKSQSQSLGPVTRKSRSIATGNNNNNNNNTTTTTQRRTRKVSKPEKPRWKRVVSILTKQLIVLLILVGLIQLTRKMISIGKPEHSSSSSISSLETEMAFSELESRIAEVDSFVKATTSTMQVQVELLDKKMEKEAKNIRQGIDTKYSSFETELKKLDSRANLLEKSIDEVNAKPWVTKDDLERVYNELKKGNVDDSAFKGINIDEMRAYARDVMEKEIEKHAADGLGRVDFALASSGAYVMHHSDPYFVGKGIKWFATSTRRAHANAVKMLSPSFGEPGQCFALKGSNGFVQIKLRGPIVPEAFTLEHVAKSVAYDRASAPKDCSVSGWLEGKEQDPTIEIEKIQLTEFTYDLDKTNAQTFNVLDSSKSGLVNTIRLDFTSNHGSDSHTCIYRFRVHGHTSEPVSVVETES